MASMFASRQTSPMPAHILNDIGHGQGADRTLAMRRNPTHHTKECK